MNIVDMDVDADSFGELGKSKDDAMLCKINMARDVKSELALDEELYIQVSEGVKMENEQDQV